MQVLPPRAFFQAYTKDLTNEDLGKLFTRETPGGLPVLRARHQHRRARRPALAPARRQVPAGILPRVHDAAVAGAPHDLRRGAGVLGHRPAAAVRRLRRHAVPMPIALFFVRIGVPGPDLRQRHGLAAHRVPADEPAGAARSGGSAVAQARSRSGARDPAGDAARRHVVGPGRRGVRADQAGQHRRRRLLRHPAAARRHVSSSRSATSPARRVRRRC